MILTENKTYTMTVTRVNRAAESGLGKEDMLLEYTGQELLHEVLSCACPAFHLTGGYKGKSRMELYQRIALVECALEERGDQLVKSERTMYLDLTERSTIFQYLGLIFTGLVSRKLAGTACLLPVGRIVPEGYVRYRGSYRQDLAAWHAKEPGWSIWQAVGRSENSPAAFETACRNAADVSSVNGAPPLLAAACMIYYERGHITAMYQEPTQSDRTAVFSALDFLIPQDVYFREYYRPVCELLLEERPEYAFAVPDDCCEAALTLPSFAPEGARSDRRLCLSLDAPIFAGVLAGDCSRIPELLCAGAEKEASEDSETARTSTVPYRAFDGIAVW